MNPIFKISQITTVSGKNITDFDAAVNAALGAGRAPFGSPYVFGTDICQSFVTRVLDRTLADLAAQAVADAVTEGTVLLPFDKTAADAQAVAEAIAAGTVVPAPKP